MSFALYDDRLSGNKKIAWLRSQGLRGIAALGLHLLANTWCRHEGMQGFLPAYMPEQLVGRDWRRLAALLVECNMFEAIEGGWMIHDYEKYGQDDGTPTNDKLARISEERAKAGRKGGLAKAAKSGGKTDSKPPGKAEANGQQSSSPIPIPTNSTTSTGSRNAPAGFGAQVVRAYVTAARDAGLPAPEESQAAVERSARSLLGQGFPIDDVLEAARNAGVQGWTNLATQLQRDAARASPATNGKPSTTDQRFHGALDLAEQLDRKALG